MYYLHTLNKALPFVHNGSIVVHKVFAEGAKWTEKLEWDFFWHEHGALQNTDGAVKHLTV